MSKKEKKGAHAAPSADSTDSFFVENQSMQESSYEPVNPLGKPLEIAGKRRRATASLVCGIFAVLFSVIPPIGLILGIIALALAVSHRKERGKDSRATGGKACGIIAIILSVLCAGAIAFVAVFHFDEASAFLQNTNQSLSDSLTNLNEEEARSKTATALDELCKFNTTELDSYGSYLEASYLVPLGIEAAPNFEAIGIDKAAFAKQWVSPLNYSIESIDGSSDVAGTAFVYVDFTQTNPADFQAKLNDQIAAFHDQNAEGTELSNETLGMMFKNALDMSETSKLSWNLKFVYENNTWNVEKQSLVNLSGLLFGYGAEKTTALAAKSAAS